MAEKKEKDKINPLNGIVLLEREKKPSIFDSSHLPSHQYIYRVVSVGKDIMDLKKDSKVFIALNSLITPVVGAEGTLFFVEKKYILGEEKSIIGEEL